jgi:hypothetical protein
MDDLWDMAKIFGLAAVAVLLLFAILAVPIHFAEKKVCESRGMRMDVTVEHTMWTGCLVKNPYTGRFVPYEAYRWGLDREQ